MLVNGRFLSQSLSGVQRYGLEVTTALVARGSNVRVLCPPGSTVPAHLRHVTTSLGSMTGHAWEQRELAACARARGSVLWSPGNTGPVTVARQIVTVHDMFPYSFPQHHQRSFRSWYKVMHRGLVFRGARFAAVSLYTRDEITRYLRVPAEEIFLVPNGVGTRFQTIDRAVARESVARLGIRGRFVLALGTASARKNFTRLADSWRLVRRRFPDVELVLAGSAGNSRIFDHSQPDERLTPGDGVRRVGHVSDADLPAIYGAAEALVMPSLAEGFGLPPLEALACGTPIVVSANSALVEMFAPVGAVLVDPYSIESIAGGVICALDAAQAVGQRNVSALIAEYTWSRAAERLLAAVAEVRTKPC